LPQKRTDRRKGPVLSFEAEAAYRVQSYPASSSAAVGALPVRYGFSGRAWGSGAGGKSLLLAVGEGAAAVSKDRWERSCEERRREGEGGEERAKG
jgi:hypothetical protein